MIILDNNYEKKAQFKFLFIAILIFPLPLAGTLLMTPERRRAVWAIYGTWYFNENMRCLVLFLYSLSDKMKMDTISYLTPGF